MGVHAPELLLLIAIDVFLVLSLVTCLFDEYFPTSLPYLLQLLALAGFGQLYLSKSFMSIFIGDGRFWSSLFFLMSSMACVLATNMYLFLVQKRLDGGIVYMGAVTMPVSYFTLFIVSVYLNQAPLPMFMFPTLPFSMSLGVLVMTTGLLCLGIIVSQKPQFVERIKIRLLENFAAFQDSLSKIFEDGKKQVRGREKKGSQESVPLPYLLDQMQKMEEDEKVQE
jgi:hypothetical protein